MKKSACEGGDLHECVALAIRYTEGEGVVQDFSYGYFLFERACKGGEGVACARQAEAVRRGLGVRRNPQRALALYTDACTTRQMAVACRGLAEQYALGDGIPRDIGMSEMWYGLGCEGGDAKSCVGAAVTIERGDVGPPDPVRGRSLLARACALQHARSCTLLGRRYLYGRDGAQKSLDNAAAMFQAGCLYKDPESCRHLGLMAISGKGMPKDESFAVLFLDQACDDGDYISCREITKLWFKSRSKDAMKAAARGCSLGDEASCTLKKRLLARPSPPAQTK